MSGAGRIPSLDGLRAVAILCVIASHWAREWSGAWSVGHFGVTAFFVISGFLITTLLIRERQKTGKVSVRQFYQRRVLRILPAYATFLGVIALLAAFGVYRIDARSWIGVVTYTSCFMTLSVAPILAHTWSLSVEEHFYILWPLLFRVCRPRTAMAWLGLFVVVTPLIRWAGLSTGGQLLDPNYSSPSQMGSIAVGCLLAFLLRRDRTPSIPGWAAGGVCVFGLSFATRHDPGLQTALSDSFRAIAFAMLMTVVLSLKPANPIFRLLNSKPLVQIGVLSYSLYLWQQPFTSEGVPPWLGATLLAIAAALSYYFVELPFLKLKDRFHTALPATGTGS